MLELPTFRSTGLPLLLTFFAFILLNFGLYSRLGAQPKVDRFSLPYSEDFSTLTQNPYEEFGGDWEIRDEMLIQLDTNGFDLTSFIPLTIPESEGYTFGATLKHLGGSMGGGLLFNAQQVTSRQKSHMVRFNVDNNQLWLIYGYFGDDSNFIGQGSSQLEMSTSDDSPQRLELRVTTASYDIQLNDQVIVEDVPLTYVGGAVGFISASSQIGFDDVIIEVLDNIEVTTTDIEPTVNTVIESSPIAEETVNSEFLTQELYTETFELRGIGEVRWRPINGNWAYEDNALVQKQTELFDLSNIYQNPITYPVTYLVKFRHLEGIGGGLLFNLRLPNATENAYMVRYISDADVVAWGYFDDNGAFNGIGSASVPPPSNEQHTLGIAVSDGSFDIQLDGNIIATNIPMELVVSPSYVGLTASQSMVAFDEVKLFSEVVRVNTISTNTAANIDSAAAIGTWLIEDNVVLQTDTEPTDYIAGTGLAGEQFTISANIRFDNTFEDAGAGMIFHMADRDNHASGYLVRFADHGRNIFWGQFNRDNVFSGMGDVILNNDGLDSATLKLVVKQSSFDIFVDEQLIDADIQIDRSSGWIGLVSFRGSVAFSDLNILLGEQ